MIEQIFEGPLQGILEWAIAGAIAALPIFVLVLCVDLFFRRFIAARFLVALWMLVAVRLLLPVSIESPVSLMTPLKRGVELAFAAPTEQVSNNSSTFTFQDGDGDELTVTLKDVPLDASLEEIERSNQFATAELNRAKRFAVAQRNSAAAGTALVPAQATPSPVFAVANETDWNQTFVTGLVMLWFFAGCFLLARLIVQWAVFSLRLRSCEVLDDQHFVDEMLRVCDAVGVGCRPTVREVAGLEVPAVFGVFRPTICLPKNIVSELDATQLKMVLSHEIAHVKRHDGLWVVFAQCVRAVHWVNPIAWIVVGRLRHFIEQAADDLALRRASDASDSDYGELLIRYALCSNPRHTNSAIGLLMAFPGRTLSTRIRMLAQRRQRNHWAARLTGAVLFLLVALVGLTDARTIKALPEYEARVPKIDVVDISNDEQFHSLLDGGPSTTVTYDLQKALEKIGASPEEELLSLLPTAKKINDCKWELTASELQHRQTRELIDAVEASGLRQITYTLRFIEGDLDFARQCGVVWQIDSLSGIPEPAMDVYPDDLMNVSSERFTLAELEVQPPTRPMLGAKVTPLQVQRLMRKFQSDGRCNVLHAPKVTMFNGQVGVVSDESKQSFVTGLRPVELKGEAGVEPVIRTFSEGVRIHLAGAVTESGELAMKCMLRWSEIDDVVYSRYPVPGNHDSDALIQVPRVHSNSTTIGVTMKRGESILIASPTTFGKDEIAEAATARYCLVSADWFPSP